MAQARPEPPTIGRVLVATDRSDTADAAVRWAANLAAAYHADLLVLQVVVPEIGDGTDRGVDPEKVRQTEGALAAFAAELAGSRGRARVVVDSDPAAAILDAVNADRVDTVVVGNLGMRGRKQFLL